MEIREGTKLLRFQAKRLDASVAELNALAGKVSSGKAVTAQEMDKVFAAAGKNLDYRQPQIPVVAGENEVFIESSQYHINQAKTKLAAKDQKGAAADIRKAVAYLKLEAAHAGRDLSGDYKSAVDEMETLAKNAESGVDVETAKLEQAFNRAVKDIKKHLR